MGHLDVALLRRWMMWAAVSLRTLWGEHWKGHVYWRLMIGAVVGGLLGLGTISIVDLVDLHWLRVPLTDYRISLQLPWMGDVNAAQELRNGLIAALVCAAVVPILFGQKRRMVGLVGALVLIPLAFPLLFAAAGYGAYNLAEIVVYKFDQWRRRNQPAEVKANQPVVQPKVLRK
jgi:hypothetical protein